MKEKKVGSLTSLYNGSLNSKAVRAEIIASIILEHFNNNIVPDAALVFLFAIYSTLYAFNL